MTSNNNLNEINLRVKKIFYRHYVLSLRNGCKLLLIWGFKIVFSGRVQYLFTSNMYNYINSERNMYNYNNSKALCTIALVA